MKRILNFVILYFSFFTNTYASVGLADWPVREYGLGMLGWLFLFIILSILCLIQILRIIYFLFLKNYVKIFRILKFTFIGVMSSLILNYLSQVTHELIAGDYIIFNQKQLEELGNKKKITIRGDLLIGEVNDLSSLSTIEKINGDLIFSFEDNDFNHNPKNLHSLKGLNNLKFIGGDLIISETSLDNLKGLDNLSIIEGNFTVKRNERLENLNGIEKFKKVNSLYIIRNKSLNSLKGIDSLTFSGDLTISSNELINTLEHLGNVSTINRLNISSNPKLNSLKGLESLKEIKSNLSVSGNKNLNSLLGLNNITKIGGDLTIVKNSNLTNLNGLEKLKVIQGDLQLGTYKSLTKSKRENEFDYGNKKLSNFCSLKNTEILGEIYIKNNLSNPKNEKFCSNTKH